MNVKSNLGRANSTRLLSHRFAPLVLQDRIRPWLDLVAEKDNPADLARENISHGERLSVTVSPESNGVKTRLKIQEGQIKLAAQSTAEQTARRH
ncbi:MAG: hypothetical protein MK538_06235 [Planctomycetes bacterium]|nr:hypothetical protein [Planctomycetota bacterium]